MNPYIEAPSSIVGDAVARALAEDLTPLGDITSALLDPSLRTDARFIVREAGVIAGLACATEAFAQIDRSVTVDWSVADGAAVEPGDAIGVVRGGLAPILTAERTALNFIGHLSGIASLTRRYVIAAASEGGTAQVWDTRKTTPGLRSLEKAAVRAGGGRNHRGNLSDWILFKDNHITGLGIAEAVSRARDLWPGRSIHIECDRRSQMIEAVVAGATAVLLDNMELDEIRACVAEADRLAGTGVALSVGRRCLLEVSGGVTLDTVGAISATGVDLISVGRLTNSAPVLDVGLDIGQADG